MTLLTDGSPEDEDTDAIDACANAAIQPGLFDRLGLDTANIAAAHDVDVVTAAPRGPLDSP